MTEYEASRTLVKSPPELWAELSDEVSLGGHLGAPFGHIRITRLEPETAVAWEGERASGTVRIEPSGWGTRVTLTARAVQMEGRAEWPAPEPAPDPQPDPPPDPLPPAVTAAPAAQPQAPRRGLLGFLRGLLGGRNQPGRDEPSAATPADRTPSPDAPRSLDSPPPSDSAPPRPGSQPPPAAATPALDPDAILVGVLDTLGAAHHRPFSRT